ncbi:MAG: hypothetical protein JWO28_2464 [Hyphomicrobiales bacterium]|nr:hypothetical protein [Hyphomicrobiales bacterium]
MLELLDAALQFFANPKGVTIIVAVVAVFLMILGYFGLLPVLPV